MVEPPSTQAPQSAPVAADNAGPAANVCLKQTPPSRAVFISYASQDAEAAYGIANALKQGGIEVWFDQSQLRGGEAWDQSIRRQIKGCKLFLPVISANTQVREEGYFRREWKLAVDRTQDMADDAAFLVPVVIDATQGADARVPEKFREVQWTRLPGGAISAGFIERVRGLTSSGADPVPGSPAVALPAHEVIANANRGARSRALAESNGAATVRLGFRVGILALIVIAAGLVLIPGWQKKEHARNVLLPEIQDAAASSRSDRKILDKAAEAKQYLPNDPILAKLWPAIANTMSIATEPAGAEVFWKDYTTPADDWRSAGVTPLRDVTVPRDYLRLEIRKAGYQTIELAVPLSPFSTRPIVEDLKMDRLGSLPENMVRIPKSTTDVQVVGIEKYGPREVPEFLVDKFEVTNKQFKAFVDAGGYENTSYWTVPIREGGKVIPLSAALKRFTDRTGRQGPATWEAGSYPDGTESHPVTGVSWYEAAAYAAFAHKQLPTVFHWAVVANTHRADFLIPMSNFSGKSTSVVGSLAGLSTFGVYDVAGNAREWTFNQNGNSDEHFILGGGWTDPSYAFNDAYTQPSLDRSPSNGFRCIKELADGPPSITLRESITMDFRDYSKEKPVDAATFAAFSRQFIYDKVPLGATVERTMEDDDWKAELVSIDAGYNNERLPLYIFLPRNHTAPLQPVVFFPGSNVLYESKFAPTLDCLRSTTPVTLCRGASYNRLMLFIVKSGRALVFPIYKGTYDRQDGTTSDLPDTTVRYKDHVIMWVTEYSRTIDYLETRKDMRADKVAYIGLSWGGFNGGIIPAVEKRIRVVILNVGGMAMQKALPEVDQINYLPRVTQPVLMLNGTYDAFFPVESSQKPMFRLLGTAQGDKKMLVYASGHLVPSTAFIKETLAWLDTYLGPAR